MEQDTNKKTILVLEDEMPLLKAIRIKLEASGYDVVTARSVQQALNTLEDVGKVDVIWTDHYLLGNDTGLDFVSKIKADPRWKDIPVFVVSVTASPHNVESYMSLGAKKFYTKHEYRIDDIIKDMDTRFSV